MLPFLREQDLPCGCWFCELARTTSPDCDELRLTIANHYPSLNPDKALI